MHMSLAWAWVYPRASQGKDILGIQRFGRQASDKLVKNVGIINKLRYYVDLHTLRQLYFSFIYPYLT